MCALPAPTPLFEVRCRGGTCHHPHSNLGDTQVGGNLHQQSKTLARTQLYQQPSSPAAPSTFSRFTLCGKFRQITKRVATCTKRVETCSRHPLRACGRHPLRDRPACGHESEPVRACRHPAMACVLHTDPPGPLRGRAHASQNPALARVLPSCGHRLFSFYILYCTSSLLTTPVKNVSADIKKKEP